MNVSNDHIKSPCEDAALAIRATSMEPGLLTPHERLSELASIMAVAVDRLRKRPRIDATSDSPESSQIGLEGVETTCPYGLTRQPERTPEA